MFIESIQPDEPVAAASGALDGVGASPDDFAQMVLPTMLCRGNTGAEPALGLYAVLDGGGVLCFAAVVWRRTGKQV